MRLFDRHAHTSPRELRGEDATFVAGDLKEVFTPAFVGEHGEPDVLIVDPPRAGMHKDVVGQIADLSPERFVYVSCNPQTQVRDLDRLSDRGVLLADRVELDRHLPAAEVREPRAAILVNVVQWRDSIGHNQRTPSRV